MDKPSKPMTLLQAYEELTRKETLCLREENWEALLETQAKKAKLSSGLVDAHRQVREEEKEDFRKRVQELRRKEDLNAKTLSIKMAQNRELHKKITQRGKSGSKAIRAYGQPDKSVDPRRSLTDRA